MHYLNREIYEHILITCQNSKFQLRSAYATAKLRKTGYSKNKFYIEALELYKEIFTSPLGCGSYMWIFVQNHLELGTHVFHQINIMMANGDNKEKRNGKDVFSKLSNEMIISF